MLVSSFTRALKNPSGRSLSWSEAVQCGRALLSLETISAGSGRSPRRIPEQNLGSCAPLIFALVKSTKCCSASARGEPSWKVLLFRVVCLRERGVSCAKAQSISDLAAEFSNRMHVTIADCTKALICIRYMCCWFLFICFPTCRSSSRAVVKAD
jgi:hypothetical protein